MRAHLALALFSAAGTLGCQSREQPATEAAPSARAPSSRASSSSLPAIPRLPSALPEQRQIQRVGCRVLSVFGPNAKTSGAAYQGRFFDGNGWLELGADVGLSLKHSETTREFAVHGPGRFLVCPGGDESVLVASGVFSSTAGPGSRAGAEVLVGTPFGAVRYGDANLRLDVRPKGLELNVKKGSAVLDRPSETDAGSATRTLEGPDGRVSFVASADAERLVAQCTELRARVARGRKPSVPAAASAGPLLSNWAVAQLKARQEARIACATASAASSLRDEPARSRLMSLLGTPDASALRDTETALDAGK